MKNMRLRHVFFKDPEQEKVMNIQDALDWRYAVREFSDEKLSHTQIENLMEATRKSASSYGLQPYKLIVIESKELREKLLPHSYGQQKVVDCSHLVVFAAHKKIGYWTVDRYIQQYIKARNVSYESVSDYSRHMKQALTSKTPAEQREWAHQQAYIAIGTFLTAAATLQIDSCPMTGFDAKAYDEVLDLEAKGLETTAVAALGYRSQNDKSASMNKVRFDYDELVLSL